MKHINKILIYLLVINMCIISIHVHDNAKFSSKNNDLNEILQEILIDSGNYKYRRDIEDDTITEESSTESSRFTITVSSSATTPDPQTCINETHILVNGNCTTKIYGQV